MSDKILIKCVFVLSSMQVSSHQVSTLFHTILLYRVDSFSYTSSGVLQSFLEYNFRPCVQQYYVGFVDGLPDLWGLSEVFMHCW